jgi:hypothetical protein
MKIEIFATTGSPLYSGEHESLAAAVSEAKQLDAAATAVAKPWFEEAKAHLAATKGLATLTSEAVARIGVSASGGLVSPASAAPEATGGTPATKVGG